MIPLADARFWKKVDKNGPIPPDRPDLGPCWIWRGTLTQGGYGRVRRGRAPGIRYPAHLVAYFTLRGIIPEGLEPDHLCRIRRCVHPWHIEPVTHKVNMERGGNALKTQCPRGHEYSNNNTMKNAKGGRYCRTCHNTSRNEKRREERRCARLKSKLSVG